MMQTVVDINENRHRYYFTREATQKDMEARFGVTVETIGKYYPNRALATPAAPPLAIQLRGPDAAVEKALQFIHQVLQNGPPPSTTHQPSGFQRKLYLGFVPEPGRLAEIWAMVLGPPPGASFLLYISRTAGPGTSTMLRGQGSGHVVLGSTLEQLAEPMHLLITTSTERELEDACTLAEDLFLTVRHCYEHRVKLF